jgi:hypothetical protein
MTMRHLGCIDGDGLGKVGLIVFNLMTALEIQGHCAFLALFGAP